MLPQTAVSLVNESLMFLPGWHVKASDFTSRHEGAICVYVSYPGHESNRPEAMAGYPVTNEPRAVTVLQVGLDWELTDLFRAVLNVLIMFITHEFREFLRVRPTGWAPFHPHQIDGIARWGGNPTDDLTFGFNAMKWELP